jgi:hypothetical protein
MTAWRTVAHWIGVALLVAVSALGLWSSIESLGSDTTTGQQVATFTQFGYALGGFAAATGQCGDCRAGSLACDSPPVTDAADAFSRRRWPRLEAHANIPASVQPL